MCGRTSSCCRVTSFESIGLAGRPSARRIGDAAFTRTKPHHLMRTPRKQYVFCKVGALFDFSPRTLNAQSQDGDHTDESAGSFESNSCFPRRPTDDGTIGSFVLSHASASHGVSPNGSDAGASGTGLQASSLDRGIDWGAVRFVLVCARQPCSRGGKIDICLEAL